MTVYSGLPPCIDTTRGVGVSTFYKFCMLEGRDVQCQLEGGDGSILVRLNVYGLGTDSGSDVAYMRKVFKLEASSSLFDLIVDLGCLLHQTALV